MSPTTFPRYRELPAELRHMIRSMAIDAQLDPGPQLLEDNDAACEQVCRRQSSPPLSPNTTCGHISHLACVDKEWQEDVEKRSFRKLTLCFSLHEEDGFQDFLELAGIVTKPRRRFIVTINTRCVISAQGARSTSRSLISNHAPSRYAVYNRSTTNTFHRCVRGLYDVLKYWAVEDVRYDLLKIRFYLSLDFDYTPPQRAPAVIESIGTDLSSLPIVKVVGCMKVYANEIGIFVTPADALLQIYRATPSLTSVGASFHPHCCEGDSNFLPMIQDFCNKLQTAAPRLTQLKLEIPSDMKEKRDMIYKSCRLHGSLGHWQESALITPLLVTLRDVSYRLESLRLSMIGNPLPFFESFLKEPYDPDSVSHPSWPVLRTLVLNSTVVFTKNEHVASAYDDHENRILLAMGRAIRFMPKLKQLSATTFYFTDKENKKRARELGDYLTALNLGFTRSGSCRLTITCGLYAPSQEILKTIGESLTFGPRLSATISVVVLKEASSTGDDEVHEEDEVADQEADDEVHEEDEVADQEADDEVHEEDEVADQEANDEVHEEDEVADQEADDEVLEEYEVADQEADDEVHEEDDESANGKVIHLTF